MLKKYLVCEFSLLKKMRLNDYPGLLSLILLTSNVSKYFLRSFLYNLLQKLLCLLYFFKDCKYDIFKIASLMP